IPLNEYKYYISTSCIKKPPCPICNIRRCSRIFHCSICGKCCILFDHHCPFTGNCVGINNFKYFYLWLTYCVVGLIYCNILSFQAFYYCILNWKFLSTNSYWNDDECRAIGKYSFTFPLVLLGLISVLWLWVFETYLLYKNQ